MTSTLATRQVTIGDYVLSVTTRDAGDDPALLEELTFRTIGAFLYLAGLLEKGVHEAGVTGSVEQRLAAEKGIEFKETFVDPRVTVWDSYRGAKNPSFHLNSDDEPQVAMNTYMANDNAIRRAIEKYGTSHNTPPVASGAVSSASVPQQAMSTHETDEQRAQIGLQVQNGVVRVNGKKAAKELSARSHFIMPIAQIGAVMSRDGKLTWELFGFYGGKAGQYCDLVVYADNEIAIKNGLVASLEAIINKPGSAITGAWIAAGAVGEKEGKKSLYTNAIAETEELLAIARERGDKHPGMADDLPSVS